MGFVFLWLEINSIAPQARPKPDMLATTELATRHDGVTLVPGQLLTACRTRTKCCMPSRSTLLSQGISGNRCREL